MSERAAPNGATHHGAPSVVNIANGLTALRLALVPVFGWLLVHEDGQLTVWRWCAAAVFVIAGLTDKVDGDLARRHGLVTDVGKIADPIADKALTGTALVLLSVLGELPWWVTVLVLVREVMITLLRLAVVRRVVLPAGRGGKVKTALQALAILLYVMPLSPALHAVAVAVMAVAVMVTVATGLHYLIAVTRAVRSS